MEKLVKLSYEEFCSIKASGYSCSVIKKYICKHLNCELNEIEDFDFNYKLTFSVWLKDKVCYCCKFFDTSDCPLQSSTFNLDESCSMSCEKFSF